MGKLLPIATFIVGGLIGAFTSYILTCNKYKKEIDEMKNFYDKELKKKTEELDKTQIAFECATKLDDDISKFVEVVEPTPDFDRTACRISKVVDYSKLQNTEKKDETQMTDDYENYVKNYTYPEQIVVDYPRLITEEEAAESYGYENVGVEYYIKEDLCFFTDHDMPIDSEVDEECLTLDNLIGEINLETFKHVNTDIIYVKNEETKQIFEIYKVYKDSPVAMMKNG